MLDALKAANPTDPSALRLELALERRRFAQRNRNCLDLKAELTVALADLAAARTQIEAFQAQEALLQEELDRAQSQLSAVLNSTFWRLTAPLRLVASSLRRPIR